MVVLHEFVLHHLRMWMALNGGQAQGICGAMERRYGEEGREAARRVLLGQFPEALFKYPLSDEVIERAAGIIVHSRLHGPGLCARCGPTCRWRWCRWACRCRPLSRRKCAGAARPGPGPFVVSSVGHLNPYKRVSATLRAFKALVMQVPRACYLLVGSRSPNYDPAHANRHARAGGLGCKIMGYVPQEELPYYLAASDVCVNLRYPTAGETSASLLRIMGAGVPVLVSRTGSFKELPDDAAGKMDIGDIEEELLLEYLLLLARRPDLRQAMSEAARGYVAEHHTLEGAARGYLEFLVALRGTSEAVEVQPLPAQAPSPILATPAPPLHVTVAPRAQDKSENLDGDPLAIIAKAAAELGVSEKDDTSLSGIARSLEGLVPSREGVGGWDE